LSWEATTPSPVAQISESAVSQVSKPARRGKSDAPGKFHAQPIWKIGDTAGLETALRKITRKHLLISFTGFITVSKIHAPA
jgi:hypothetical protein